MLQATLLDCQGGADRGFEKVLGTERFESLRWFRTALDRCRSVGRVEDPHGEGVGTCLVLDGPRLHPRLPEAVLMTNAHVVGSDDLAALAPERARVTFRALGDCEATGQRQWLAPWR